MFSSQRNKTPRTPSSIINHQSKAKAVAFYDEPPPLPPPTTLLSATQSGGVYGGRNLEDWKKFKEVGLLDESSLVKKDQQALLQNISRLQSELSDYQYNMGLLLIEKKELVSKTEELGQEFVEAQEILKRERVAHLIAVSEAEKREENLKKAINVERKSLLDLERAIRDIHEEHAKAKSTCETTVVDLNTRMEDLHKQNFDVGERSRSVDAKLVELDRKNFELDKKLQDLEDRENMFQREQLSLAQERQSHELYLRKHKNDIFEWEKKLQEGEQRLCDSRRLLNEREEKVYENETSSKVKESHIEDLQKRIDLANATSKKVEDDVDSQLADLDMKEKNIEAMRKKLEEREKQLLEEEQKLGARERVELENILNEHNIMLISKMHEFESDMKHKRAALEEELRNRKDTVDQTETKINHLEVKLRKREQALEKKKERMSEKEKDFEVNNKTLKEQEKCLKSEVKRIEADKKQVSADKESLEIIRKEIEMLRNSTKEQELRIEEEWRILEAAEREKLEYVRLQSSLKQEIDSVRRQSDLIEKEAGDLKLEREKFEKDWEALDEKRIVVENELKTLAENKAMFEKLQNSEVERLKRERAEFEERVLLELENTRLLKESFEATMESEKAKLAEEAKRELALMHQEFELQKEDLHNDMQKRREEWRKLLEEKERTLEEMQSREIKNVKQVKKDAEKKRDHMEIERHSLEKERKTMELNKKQLEEASVEIIKDIEVLDNLSKKMKKQREQLVREKEHFSTLIEKIKCCHNCGDSAQELRCDLHLPTVVGPSLFPRISLHGQSEPKDDSFRESKKGKLTPSGEVHRDHSTSGGKTSVLRKCASIIFNLSPKTGVQHTDNHFMEEFPHSAPLSQAKEFVREQAAFDEEAYVKAQLSSVDEPGSARKMVHDGNKMPNLDVGENNNNNNNKSLKVNELITDSEVQGIKESEKSDVKTGQRKPGSKRRSGVRRTHSVKEVVEDAKSFLRVDSLGKLEEQPSDSAGANLKNQEKTKRSRSQASEVAESEQHAEYSEGNADSVTTGGRRKRRPTASSALPTPGPKRYNLRRHTVAASSGKAESKNEVTYKDTNQVMHNPEETPTQSLDIADESSRRLHLAQVSTTRSIELTSDKCNATDVADSHGNAVKSVENEFTGEVKTAEGVGLMSEINEISENAEDTKSMVNKNEDDDNGSDNDDYEGEDEDEDDDDDDDDGDDEDLGQSFGKKLWKFLST